MKSKRFVLNALLVVALLALLAFSCWYANQPSFGYVLYTVMSGDKAYYTLRARNVNRTYLESESSMEPSMPVLVSSFILKSSSLAKGFLKKPVASG